MIVEGSASIVANVYMGCLYVCVHAILHATAIYYQN